MSGTTNPDTGPEPARQPTPGNPRELHPEWTSRRGHDIIKDSLGSVIGIFDATGAWQGGYTYSPFGEARNTASTASALSNPVRYTSGYLDSASGQYKLGARFYDPSVGRFSQTDPSGQEANPYVYGGDDPINSKDPSGLFPFKLFVKIVAALIAGRDVYTVLGPSPDKAALSAGFDLVCGAVAAAIAAPTAVGGLVALGGCIVLGIVFDKALYDD